MSADAHAHARLAAEHEALIQFLYLAPVGLVQTASDGEILMINPISAQLLMPLARDGNLANLFAALEDVAPELRHLVAGFGRPSGMVCDGLHVHLGQSSGGDGEGRPRRAPQVLSLTLLKLDEARLMAVLLDVTEQVRRERQLRQNDAWLNALLTGISGYALVGLDRDGRVSEWNATIGRVTGHGESVVGQPYSVFYPQGGTTAEQVQDRLREADQNGWSLDEGARQRADGSQFWASAMISPLPDRPGEADFLADPRDAAYCMVLRDIGDKREAIESRRRSAFADHLTGVANRRAFFEAAELELQRNRRSPRPTALVLIDADHFKRINDGHGHAGGDAVLRQLGQLLTHTFRQVDVVARIGGEEFAVLLPSSTLAGAAAVAERLRQLVAQQACDFDGARIACTVSAGVAAVEEGEPATLETLMRRADQALYAAKAAGRNRVACWTPALATAAGPAARR